MLVLSRKSREEIVLSNGVRIAVLSIRPDRVQLGVTAPEDVSIMRRELLADDRTVPPSIAAFVPEIEG